ncbi:hypothetical protein [Oerskovia enterophila]|uniref:hypothetical protein n=1 Tax=Oerskovia enterophila TaxID=43678 RepID=UPI00339210E1
MSTDDLTARARAEVRTLDAVPEAAYTSALLSELADVVDRLRADNERYHALYVEAVDTAVHAGLERDAARAALERVRAAVEDGDRLDGLWIYAPDLDRALEGSAEAPTHQHRCTCRQLTR